MEVCKECKRQYILENDYLTGTSHWHISTEGDLWFNCSCGHLLQVKKGKFPWFTPEKILSPDKATLFNLLAKKSTMPYIPTSVMELQIAIADPKLSAIDLANTAKKDPLLSADILSHANTMKLSDGQKISSLIHAFSYIGRKTISDLVLVAAVKSFKFKTKHFTSKEFWQKSKITGFLSEHLAGIFAPNLEPDQAYLSGSLCNIGKVIAAICIPETLEKIYLATNDQGGGGVTWAEAERKFQAPSHITLGEIACTIWGLPSYITEAASDHHRTADLKSSSFSIGEITAFSNQICHILLGEDSQLEDMVFESYMQKTKMRDTQLASLITDLKSKLPADLNVPEL